MARREMLFPTIRRLYRKAALLPEPSVLLQVFVSRLRRKMTHLRLTTSDAKGAARFFCDPCRCR